MRPIRGPMQHAAPVLVVSGTADDRTPLEEARALFERAPQPKRFWAVEGAGHIDLERHDPDRYWCNVLPFLARHLRRADQGTRGGGRICQRSRQPTA